MSATVDNPNVVTDPRLIPGGITHTTEMPNGSTVVFEDYGPGQWLTKAGEPAKTQRRRYLLDGEVVESVSTLGDTLRKKGLEVWKEWMGASGALKAERMGELGDVDPEDGKGIVARTKMLRLDSDTKSQEAALRGTAIHDVFDALSNGRPAPNPADFPGLARPWLAGAMKAWAQLEIEEVVAAEQVVAHPVLRYAGRFDLVARRKSGRVALFDYKTSAKGVVYPQAHWTTRLYEMAARECGIEIDEIVIVGISDAGHVDPVLCDVSVAEAEALVLVARAFSRIERDAGTRARRLAKEMAA